MELRYLNLAVGSSTPERGEAIQTQLSTPFALRATGATVLHDRGRKEGNLEPQITQKTQIIGR